MRVRIKGAYIAKKFSCRVIPALSPPSISFISGYIEQRKTKLPLELDYRDQ